MGKKTKKILATLLAQTQTSDDKPGHIQGVANSLTTSRDGTLITQEAAKQAVGKSVPLLLSHNWDSMPVGAVEMTAVDEEGLHYEGRVFENVENREQILEGISAGVLAVSVGFLVDGFDKDGSVTALDLLELSITPVPADASATLTQELEIQGEAEDDEDPADPDTDPEPQDDAPTLQDVLDAINAQNDTLAQILAAVSPDDDEDPADPDTDPEPAAEQLTLDKVAKFMLDLTKDEPNNYADARVLISKIKEENPNA